MKNYNVNDIHVITEFILASLEECQISESSITNYRNNYNVFEKYLSEQGITIINEEVCLDYLLYKTGTRPDSFWSENKDRNLNRRMKPLHLLLLYLETGEFRYECRKKKEPFLCPEEFSEEYAAYYSYLSQCELAQSTVETNIKKVQSLLQFFDKRSVTSSDKICILDIQSYIEGYKDKSIKYMGTIMYVLRKYFGFLYQNGFCTENLAEQLPKMKIPRNGAIPHGWTKDELHKILCAIDREDPAGKRNYAIFLLTIQSGLRAGDIRNLRLKDIDWNKGSIHVVMGKTGNPLEIPLLHDVGWAIIDYLKHGRPETVSDCVFIRHKAPFGQIGSTATLDKALHRYLVKAGIVIKGRRPHGMHSLRNALAKNMLDSGTPVPVISQTLGHQDIKTTQIYLKIDLNGLKQCTLDPEEVYIDERL